MKMWYSISILAIFVSIHVCIYWSTLEDVSLTLVYFSWQFHELLFLGNIYKHLTSFEVSMFDIHA